MVLFVTLGHVLGGAYDKKEPSIEKKALARPAEPRQSSQDPEKPEATGSEDNDESDEETFEDGTVNPEVKILPYALILSLDVLEEFSDCPCFS